MGRLQDALTAAGSPLHSPWPKATLGFALLALNAHALGRSWPLAAVDGGLLFALMVAHAWCYARWQPAAPRRILLNEALARVWFVVYAGLLAGLLGRSMLATLLSGTLWAGASWVVHANRVRKGYVVGDNVLQLAIFLLGLSCLLRVA